MFLIETICRHSCWYFMRLSWRIWPSFSIGTGKRDLKNSIYQVSFCFAFLTIKYVGIPLSLTGAGFFFVCNGLFVIQIITYLRCVFTDPGRIPEGMKAPFQSKHMKMVSIYNKCTGLETWKPQRAHHCWECGYCIFKMDHHCPWINNCVGYRNMKYFMLFNFYTFLSSIMLVICMLMAFINLITDINTRRHMRRPVGWHVYD